MSKKNRLEKEIDFLKEKYRGYFLALIALLSGEAGVIYTVVSSDKSGYVLWLALAGLIAFASTANKLAKIEEEIEKKFDALEKEL